MRIALTGNPNSGKTSLFNAITGKVEYVGNWAGVTIEKKEGKIKDNLNTTGQNIIAVDLPGAYSMSPFTNEETITSEFVKTENPDVIINIVDATNLSRTLFFTSQLLELGIPVVVALNKSDSAKSKEIEIDTDELSKILNAPVIKTVATNPADAGLVELITAAANVSGKGQTPAFNLGEVNTADAKEAVAHDTKRYELVKEVVAKVEARKTKSNQKTMQDAFDGIVANKWLGIPVFALVMYLIFSISQTYVGPVLADYFVGLIDGLYAFVEGLMSENTSPIVSAVLLDGVIGGVGAVVGFLPLIMVMFFLVALLEDWGYMARVAVVMDRFLKVVGLSGKAIIPMVIGTGCAIPGVMATRTIKNERQRRTAAMLTPFMPCGAKIPVIALFAGVFFENAGWVSTLMYFSGIAIIIVGAYLVMIVTGEKNKNTYFIMELPEYKIPSLKRATISMLSRGKEFIIKATTIILLCNAAVQIMQTFNWSFEVIAQDAQSSSILASLASPLAIILVPLGFGTWQLAAAAITGFIAKENVVGTLAVVYSITNFIDTDALEVVGGTTEIAAVMGLTSVAALSYLMFNLFTPPCFAAIGAMRAEMESSKWLWSAIALQFGTGYTVAYFINQIGTLMTTGAFAEGFLFGGVIVAVLIGILVSLVIKGNKQSSVKAVKQTMKV